MLYGNRSVSNYTFSNITISMLMAFQAGSLNVGGFITCNSFVSHVTGYATLFGLEVQKNNVRGALVFLSVSVFFLLGAIMSGWLVDLQIRLQHKPKYFLIFGVLFFLNLIVMTAGIYGYFGPFGAAEKSINTFTLLSLLSLICGFQNGTITSISNTVVRTTHLTGITTDLGIGLMRLLNYKHFSDRIVTEKNATLIRVGLIGSFVTGSTCGAFAFSLHQYFGFLIPVGISGSLFILMLYFQVLKKTNS